MIIRDESKNWIGIACDNCEVRAPSAVEILEAHGLMNRGWHCSGGVHLCARCAPETTRDIGPRQGDETIAEYHARTGLSR